MEIKFIEVKIKEILEGYTNNNEKGVYAYKGRLNIRPSYQREFIYDDKKQNMVIDTVLRDLPLNIMYWVKTGKNEIGEDTYEVLDGQQRTMSICEFASGQQFTYINPKDETNKFTYRGLDVNSEKKKNFDNYKLLVYICDGTYEEKLDWFRTINIAGEKLTDQELRNAMNTGEWLTDAKKFFNEDYESFQTFISKNDWKQLFKGDRKRQEWLEESLKWISHKEYGKEDIDKYMAEHKADKNAFELKRYIKDVYNWVYSIFDYHKSMEKLDWGIFFNEYSTKLVNKSYWYKERQKGLLNDDEVQKYSGIYEYLFTNNEKYLNLRKFNDKDKNKKWLEQKKRCANKNCLEKEKELSINEVHADHIIPWSKGGKTEYSNLQILCKNCNLEKSDK